MRVLFLRFVFLQLTLGGQLIRALVYWCVSVDNFGYEYLPSIGKRRQVNTSLGPKPNKENHKIFSVAWIIRVYGG